MKSQNIKFIALEATVYQKVMLLIMSKDIVLTRRNGNKLPTLTKKESMQDLAQLA